MRLPPRCSGNGDLSALDEATLKAATSELPSATVGAGALGIIELLVASGLSESKSAARRTVGEGGAYVNNAKVSDPDAVIAASQLLHGRYLLLRRGKKNLATVEVLADSRSAVADADQGPAVPPPARSFPGRICHGAGRGVYCFLSRRR